MDMKTTQEMTLGLVPIGQVRRNGEKVTIEVAEPYRPALKELDQFSHVLVFWWFSDHDNAECRQILQVDPPYGENPPKAGVFATRSPVRPNPIGLTTAKIVGLDLTRGILEVNNLDAFDGTPVVDLKAYFPTLDRVKDAGLPAWIPNWGEWVPEEGIGFFEDEAQEE